MLKKNASNILFVFIAALVGVFLYYRYRVAPGFDFFKSNDFTAVSGMPVQKAEQLRGKKIILTFYASWCRDCLKEMKTLNELKKGAKLDSTVAIVAVSDQTADEISSFAEKKQYPFHFFRLTKSFPEMKMNSIPVNYLINRKGETVYEKVGSPDWEDPDWVRQALRMME